MIKATRDAIVALLPKHAFVENLDDGAHIDVKWTTTNGVFRLDTGRWEDNGYTVNNTRTRLFNDSTGEYAVLRTENVDRIAVALELFGAL